MRLMGPSSGRRPGRPPAARFRRSIQAGRVTVEARRLFSSHSSNNLQPGAFSHHVCKAQKALDEQIHCDLLSRPADPRLADPAFRLESVKTQAQRHAPRSAASTPFRIQQFACCLDDALRQEAELLLELLQWRRHAEGLHADDASARSHVTVPA
jgi:hypothetical protein